MNPPLTLTEKQQQFLRELSRPEVKAVTMLGEAGAGKSTVGLLALLRVAQANPGRTLALACESRLLLTYGFGDLIRLADGWGVWEQRDAASSVPCIRFGNGAQLIGLMETGRAPMPGLPIDSAFFDGPIQADSLRFFSQLLTRALAGMGGNGKLWLAGGQHRPAWVDTWCGAPTVPAACVRMSRADNPHLPGDWDEGVRGARCAVRGEGEG